MNSTRPDEQKNESRAEEVPDIAEWDRLAQSPEFKALTAAKLRFILPATIFFIIYYFALPILVGWAPELMKREVIGRVNLAYLFALSQFFVAWFLAWLYLRAANRFDRMAQDVLNNHRRRP